MRCISIDEYLNDENPWFLRLLDPAVNPCRRTRENLQSEWDEDYYGKILKEYENDIEPLRDPDLSRMTDEIAISLGDRLFLTPNHLFVALKRHYMMLAIKKYLLGDRICELGAGYGTNLMWLRRVLPHPFYGGEFSRNALRLARKLGNNIELFDFYDSDSYTIIQPGSTVYTSHAIEQISDVAVVVENLRSVADRIQRVIHFEPTFLSHRQGLLGNLRNRYIELNDYNRNLYTYLQSSNDIRILHLDFDLFGNNPLNPSNLIVWEFKQ